MSEAKECVAVSETRRISFRGLGHSLTANSHTVHGTDKAGGRTHGSHCDADSGQGPGRHRPKAGYELRGRRPHARSHCEASSGQAGGRTRIAL